MITDEIRELLNVVGAVLVVQDGSPAYVITEYGAWRQMMHGQPVRVSNGRPGHLSPQRPAADAQESHILERLNKEILSLRNQIQMQEEASAPPVGGLDPGND